MIRFLALALLLLPCFAPSVHAGEPSTDPVLRIETGMHTAMVRRLAVDAQGRWVASISEDKTIRVWDAADGALLKTMRIPLGEGAEGKIYCVAISPDGGTIVVGGYTGWAWDSKIILYAFDRESGRMLTRFGEGPNAPNNLAFSPDGNHVVAIYGNSGGMRAFAVGSWNEIAHDSDYGDDSYFCGFSPDGRLFTSAWDGKIRVYDRTFHRIASFRAGGGEKPMQIAFNPSQDLFAVGYNDTIKVDLFKLGDHTPAKSSPDTSTLGDGTLSSVAWSPDGKVLYAAGGHFGNASNSYCLFAWERGTTQTPTEFKGAKTTVMDMRMLADGGLALSSVDPTVAVIDPPGRDRWRRESDIADMRYNKKDGQFLISLDGSQVSFDRTWGSKNKIGFDMNARALIVGEIEGQQMIAPRRTGLDVQGWDNSYTPSVNGNKLTLKRYETARSLAIAPGNRSFLLGAYFTLYHFDAQGKELWRRNLASTPWGVNVSADGRWGVAALGDGTVRWFRMSDGQEELALFVHNDATRWIIWTPSGYFDASVGAENLIGWHLNRGKTSEAIFYPASKFRGQFYRPDVIARVLDAGSAERALQLANETRGGKSVQIEVSKLLPPDIRITAPAAGTTFSTASVVIRYRLSTPSGEPVTGVKAYVDGRPAIPTGGRGVTIKGKGEDGESTIEVPVPNKDCTVALIAENRYASSDPAVVKLSWGGQAQIQDEAFVAKPKLYVLAIGVSDYDDPHLKLGLAAKDARDFAAALHRQEGRLYREVEERVLADKDATGDNILDGLDWLVRQTTAKDVGILFLAGHGVNDSSGDYYYLPVDTNLDRLRRTGVPFFEIKKTVENLAGKALFFVDTCHSGNVMGSRRGVADINAVVNELSTAETGAVVFASSTGNQYSLEDPKWGNGAFTKALIEGIEGRADFRHTGRITINMLDLYLSERVKELTGGQQTPTTTKPSTVPDFPVVVTQ